MYPPDYSIVEKYNFRALGMDIEVKYVG